jgi:hypothetical protein
MTPFIFKRHFEVMTRFRETRNASRKPVINSHHFSIYFRLSALYPTTKFDIDGNINIEIVLPHSINFLQLGKLTFDFLISFAGIKLLIHACFFLYYMIYFYYRSTTQRKLKGEPDERLRCYEYCPRAKCSKRV